MTNFLFRYDVGQMADEQRPYRKTGRRDRCRSIVGIHFCLMIFSATIENLAKNYGAYFQTRAGSRRKLSLIVC